MRLYLDTNILIFLLNGEDGRIDRDTAELLYDPANALFTSAASAHELVDLILKGRLERKKKWRDGESVIDQLARINVTVEPVTEKHVREEERLPLYSDHRDPFDRLIIAQAISDRTKLVSSDHLFHRYVRYGLDLHENERGKARDKWERAAAVDPAPRGKGRKRRK
ncbi:MAG: type II toxin-antitoxin system VapC family toxin [Prevotellaceae bacterium]|nr:type II toxin-antitoxin system VapC family toxin [Prevotellaceae bacterium]